MKMPPYLMKVTIHGEKHRFGLWIPLFIIGPIVLIFLLAIFLITLPFALLAFMFTWRWYWLFKAFLWVPMIFVILWSLRGLKVDVGSPKEKVYISVY